MLDNQSEVEVFGVLVALLSSSGPDTYSAGRRSGFLEQARKCVHESEACRTYLGECNGKGPDLCCSSKHAYRRVIPLFLLALRYYLPLSTSDATDDEKRTVKGLIRNLCTLLIDALPYQLNKECRQQWKPLLNTKRAENKSKEAAEPEKEGGGSLVAGSFYDVAKNDSDFWSVAICMGYDVPQNKYAWSAVFAEQAFGTNQLPTQSEIEFMAPFLEHVFAAHGDWPKAWMETLLLKSKATPESGMQCLWGFVHVVVGNHGLRLKLPWQTQEEYLAVVAKQLQSTKESLRDMACQILSYAPYDSSSFVATVLPLLHKQVSKTSAMAAPQRRTLYQLFSQLALGLLENISQNNGLKVSWPVQNLDQEIPHILQAISALIGREGKSASEAKDEGMTALWLWWRVAKRNNPHSDVTSTNTVEPVMDILRKPLIAKDGPDTIAVVGHFLQTIVDPDAVEVMAMDLFAASKSKAPLEKGLDGIITNANATTSAKKQTVSVEGLISVYLGLVHALGAGGSTHPFLVNAWKASPNFIWSPQMLDAVTSSNSGTSGLVRLLLPRVMALATKWANSADNKTGVSFKSVQLARALSACIANPPAPTGSPPWKSQSMKGKRRSCLSPPSVSIASTTKTVLTYQPKVAQDLATTLWMHVNDRENQARSLVDAFYAAARQCQEIDPASSGATSDSPTTGTTDYSAVRYVATSVATDGTTPSPQLLAQVLMLMHVGSSLKGDGPQRTSLQRSTSTVLKSNVKCFEDTSFVTALASCIARCSALSSFCWDGQNTPVQVSETLHLAALSLIVSLGTITGKYFSDEKMDKAEEDAENVGQKDQAESKILEVAHFLCTKEIPARLTAFITKALDEVESLGENDIHLMFSPPGTLRSNETKSRDDGGGTAKSGASKGKKARGGFNAKEEEEWERQLKKEIAEKKKEEGAGNRRPAALTPEEKKTIAEQDEERERMVALVYGDFMRALASIRFLCVSDLEVGNGCLPSFSEPIVASNVTECNAFTAIRDLRVNAHACLVTLAASVFEIHVGYAPLLAAALTISCRRKTKGITAKAVENTPLRVDSIEDEDSILLVSPLPSYCEPAACVVREMEQLHGPLSGNSFVFLFPIVQAALVGPRATHGCDAALRVLEWHTPLLAGGEEDPVVTGLRKRMVVSVLALMKHDRAQTFMQPSPNMTLVACFRAENDVAGCPALSTAELAPLLDARGALGGKACRVGAMIALRHIASEHNGLLKKNPLIENRIWVNCFDENEAVRVEARKAWKSIHGELKESEEEEQSSVSIAPSLMYAAPLIPLLSNPDESIARAAADAYAMGMAMHSKSVSKNIQKLCNCYIEAFPSPSGVAKKDVPFPTALPQKQAQTKAPAKTSVALGLPKKKSTAKKSALAVAGIGKPAAKKKKSSALALAMLKPKQERTLDDINLASQFPTGPVQTKEESKDSPEQISARLGILLAVTALTKLGTSVQMDLPALKLLTSFLMAYGIAESDEKVKSSARNALRDVVVTHGGSDEAVTFLLPHLEEVLKKGVISDEDALSSLSTEKLPRDTDACDRRREGAVVALGSVALHLKGPEHASKIDDTIDMLLATLSTPSEDVQSSVYEILAKLMKKGNTQARIEKILTNLLQQCLRGESLASRRGAAYGLAAAVKGSGIALLKKYEIVKQLEEACASGEPNSKEGSLFAIELLSVRLGLLFEPYVIVLLPSLLKAFSDSSDYVRKAALDTCGLIMSKLSAHGVKLVMPAVLTAFDDPAWRTKEAAIRMLGAMSHLAPKQLASALPKVVPKLTEAFGYTHPKVKAAAQEALDEISTVVRNPEISSISHLLLKALTDPADNTTSALEGLIETEFLHAIDAPSLALIVPILHRGLRDRSATTKRMGALIAGNICTMINDPRDFLPYIPILLPDLKSALIDPIPDVRGTSAKALGSLVRGLGDPIVNDLRPWLIEKLGDQACSSAERSGAACGLTELLIAAGTDVTENTMLTEILPLQNHPTASTREGVLWMLTFLPPALGEGFAPLLDASLPALIGGLSDDSESVREVAMRAGRVLIRSHGKQYFDKILPPLEAGLFDVDYRIRLASLSLLGDLLSTIGGTQILIGDGDTREDIRRAERAQAQIALTLGMEGRKRVLSGLYLARSDNSSVVRHQAVQVWKTVVSVTARTLKDILPVLVGQVIVGLASGDTERTLVAGRCLGEVVTMLGDFSLPVIIPVLRKALYEGDSNTKRGVCVGLTEVIKCSSKDQILRFIEIIVKLVQDALCDEDELVCQMAAASFQSLYSVVGNRALDEVVPSLMVALETSVDDVSRNQALNGLRGILSLRSKDLLPYIVPRLVQKPVSKSHADALAGIAKVTGETIFYHFHSIVPVLLGELADSYESVESGDDEEARVQAIKECCLAICGSVSETGVSSLINEFASKSSHDKPEIRMAVCWMFESAITERSGSEDIYECLPTILRELIYRLNDGNGDVLKSGHTAWTALSKHIPAEELAKHIEFMRNLLNSMVSESRRKKGGVGDGEFFLPGFNIPKGLEPLLPIYQRGILYGNTNIREVSALGLSEAITLTAPKFLAGPLLIKMTGPLLRVVGDRNPSNVKIAILRTLGLILVRGGPALRAFVPQFQTTFVKALSDPSRQVRVEAIRSLSLLMPLSTRVDPLIKELVTGSLGKSAAVASAASDTNGAFTAVQTATLEALAAVLKEGGKKAKLPDSIRSAFDASKELLIENDDESVRQAAAKVMGATVELMDPSVAAEILQSELLVGQVDDLGKIKHGKACGIRQIFASSVGKELDQALKDTALQNVISYMNDATEIVKAAGCVAFGAVVGRSNNPDTDLAQVEPILLEIMSNRRASFEIHRAIAAGFCTLLQLVDTGGEQDNVQLLGKTLMDSILGLAMSGSQRVQYAFNDVLWLALDVENGQAGLDRYAGIAQFENVKAIRSLYTKVLTRIKQITILDDY